MMTRRSVLAVLGGGISAVLAGCDRLFPDTYRVRMTVEVETPQGLRQGASVWELAQRIDKRPIAGSGVQLTFRGEAVAIDLASGKTLFALLTSGDGDADYAKLLPGRALGSRLEGESESKEAAPWRKKAELWPKATATLGLARTNPLPMLVTFSDISDPKSVEQVDPANLAASLGAGYRLKAVYIEQTGDPVTTGVGKRLPWISRHPEVSLKPNHRPDDWTISAVLHHGDFRRGIDR